MEVGVLLVTSIYHNRDQISTLLAPTFSNSSVLHWLDLTNVLKRLWFWLQEG